MARLVLVDADELNGVREGLFAKALKTTDPLLKQRLFAEHERLTPAVPELPEGCAVMESTPFRVSVRDERRVVHSCMIGGIHNSHAGVGVQTQIDVATYLLARFQALQGGAE